MRKLCFIIIKIIFLLSTITPLSAQLADNPWPMFHYDPKNTEQSPYAGPENPEIKWSLPLCVPEESYGVESSLVMGTDGTIYLGFDSKLFAVNPSGTLKWFYNLIEGYLPMQKHLLGWQISIFSHSMQRKLEQPISFPTLLIQHSLLSKMDIDLITV